MKTKRKGNDRNRHKTIIIFLITALCLSACGTKEASDVDDSKAENWAWHGIGSDKEGVK